MTVQAACSEIPNKTKAVSVTGMPFRARLLSIVLKAHLISIKDADELIGRNGHPLWVDLGQAVVQVAGLAVHLTRLALAA